MYQLLFSWLGRFGRGEFELNVAVFVGVRANPNISVHDRVTHEN